MALMGYYILSLNQLWDFSSLYSFDIIFFFFPTRIIINQLFAETFLSLFLKVSYLECPLNLDKGQSSLSLNWFSKLIYLPAPLLLLLLPFPELENSL